MATGDQWLFGRLQALLPPDSWQFLVRHALDPDAPIQNLKRTVVSSSRSMTAEMYPLIEPVVNRALAALYNSPDIVVLAFVLAVLFLTIKILNWTRRIMIFWTRLVFRLAFWAVIIALLSLVWQRGIERSARDTAVIAGKLAGYAAVVKDIWLREYRDWEAQAAAGSRGGYGAGAQQRMGRSGGR